MAAHHARMAGQRHDGLAAIYARYSTRLQDSVADQVRAVLEDAEKLNLLVPRELVFYDLAVRGFKSQRVGLNELRAALDRKAAGTLLLFSTSRLFRKLYRTLEFVENYHKSMGIRCRFVESGIDTADKDNWEMILAFRSIMDQFIVRMTVSNIRSAHEGLMQRQLVFGTLSYGFGGRPVEGKLTRKSKPRREIVVDDEAAAVVRQIYRWYVVDGVAMSEIAQRLTADENVPLPPRSTSGQWTRQAVKGVLENTRYRGLWKYGVTEAIYQPGPDYVRQQMRAEPLREIQIDELRIVTDELWFAAQAKLAREGNRGGRKPKDGDRITRPRILNGVLVCPTHGQRLFVGGRNGGRMFCPRCACLPTDERPLFSQVSRKLALEATCKAIAEHIRRDEELISRIVAACQREAGLAQQPDTKSLPKLRADVERANKQIDFVVSSFGDSAEDREIARRQLQEIKARRSAALASIARIEQLQKKPVRVPTESEVRELIAKLDSILSSVASDPMEDSGRLLRRAMELLTGGRIELYQMGERRRHGGWLQGRFRCNLFRYFAEATDSRITNANEAGVEIIVDYRRECTSVSQAARAIALDDAGWLRKEIARELGVSRGRVTALIKQAYAERGQPFLDGRKRREELGRKQAIPPKYVQVADEVHTMADQGMLLKEIAERLQIGSHLVTKAIKHWYESRGLEVPDGRARRKTLDRKVSGPRKSKTDPPTVNDRED